MSFKKIFIKTLIIQIIGLQAFRLQAFDNSITKPSQASKIPFPSYSYMIQQKQKMEQLKRDQDAEQSKKEKTNQPALQLQPAREQEIVNQPLSCDVKSTELCKIFLDPALNSKKISINVNSISINDVIDLIGKSSGLHFVIDPDVKGTVGKFSFKDVTPGYILNFLLARNDPSLALVRDMNMWRVMLRPKAEEYLKHNTPDDSTSKSFHVNHSNITEKFKDQAEKTWTNIVGDKKAASHFYIDQERKKIFLRGQAKHIAEFESFLNEVDKVTTQIRIDAVILFAEKNYGFDFGINWSGIYNRQNSLQRKPFGFVGVGGRLQDFPEPTGAVPNLPVDPVTGDLHVDPVNYAINLFTKFIIPRSGSLSNISNTAITIPLVFGGPDLNLRRLNMVINAAENEAKVKIVSRPSVMTSDNEVAKILIGQSLPIQATAVDILAVAVQNITSINYKDIGIALEIHPTVSPDKKNIRLEVFIEESEVVGGTTLTNEKGIMQNPPIIDLIKLHNKVVLKNGQTVVIGGLLQIDERKGYNKVPFLHKLPIIGRIFRATSQLKQEFEQFIFITPTIVE